MRYSNQTECNVLLTGIMAGRKAMNLIPSCQWTQVKVTKRRITKGSLNMMSLTLMVLFPVLLRCKRMVKVGVICHPPKSVRFILFILFQEIQSTSFLDAKCKFYLVLRLNVNIFRKHHHSRKS